MLALIRAYAEEHLAACGEEAVVRASHARYYLALGDAVAAQLASRDAAAGMHRLTMDADNVRAALHWCLAHDPAAGLRLATTFAQWCEARGYASEGHRWLVELLATRARRAAG
jgi:predicted ATPase